MSFSGLKAAVARLDEGVDKNLYVRDFSEAVTEVLVAKTKIALEKYKPKSLLLGGGVAANSKIREALKLLENEYETKFFVPELKYCGDNAAMIGAAADTLRAKPGSSRRRKVERVVMRMSPVMVESGWGR